MKKLCMLFLFLVLSLVVMACGDDSDDNIVNEDGKVVLSFFGWGSAEEQENFQQLIDAFNEENEDIEAVYTGTDSGSYMNDLKNKGKDYNLYE